VCGGGGMCGLYMFGLYMFLSLMVCVCMVTQDKMMIEGPISFVSRTHDSYDTLQPPPLPSNPPSPVSLSPPFPLLPSPPPLSFSV